MHKSQNHLKEFGQKTQVLFLSNCHVSIRWIYFRRPSFVLCWQSSIPIWALLVWPKPNTQQLPSQLSQKLSSRHWWPISLHIVDMIKYSWVTLNFMIPHGPHKKKRGQLGIEIKADSYLCGNPSEPAWVCSPQCGCWLALAHVNSAEPRECRCNYFKKEVLSDPEVISMSTVSPPLRYASWTLVTPRSF